ncbi:sigma-54 dependent transcriptional regulator [Desulfoluna sp.]|uniref:sigma-54-dependent transcriptional regulator n=1 Tax=Desulfoluna sp. TaxID=2045199 RepID=UPI00261F075E|nr:sigma-54 dependent transcriptional regulator [Desulfoluna sp.]
MFPTLLIVDDEQPILHSLEGLLSDEGFNVLTAPNGYECLKTLDAEHPDLVLLDIWMPGLDGIETLREIKKAHPDIPVIMISGHGTIDTAVTATKYGAFSFIEKPISIDKMIVAINNALNFRKLEEENRFLRTRMIAKNAIDGSSGPILALKQQIIAAAPTEACILITGENGTGKELAARTIHQFSTHSENPLITLNCAAIPEALFESELFGHEKGAFEGATAKHIGRFELADGGTLFFNEIGDMNLANQGKLLQVIEEKRFCRLGGSRVIDVNVRIVAATNKELKQEIEAGRFREDLYFRLNGVPLEMPPLRNRLEDLPLLVERFTQEWSKSSDSEPKNFTPETLEALASHSWPGNVRELKNLVERLIITVNKETIGLSDLPTPYRVIEPEETPDALSGPAAISDFRQAKEAFEREYIKRRVAECNNDIAAAAKSLGVSKGHIARAMKS